MDFKELKSIFTDDLVYDARTEDGIIKCEMYLFCKGVSYSEKYQCQDFMYHEGYIKQMLTSMLLRAILLNARRDHDRRTN